MVKIFVGRLGEDVNKTELEELFKAFGDVTDCSVLKNYGFVHMADLDEAKAAIAGLDKFEMRGGPINVELSTTKVAKACKLFVGRLPPETKSAEIHKLFKPFGTVIECDVIKNYGFVHMGKESQARDAISSLHQTEFNGSKITVEMAKPKRNEGGFGGGDMWGVRGRGRGFMGMPPMRGMPRFRGRPFMQDPYMEATLYRRGGMRPRMPMRGRGAAGLGSMYERDVLAARARRQMFYGGGDTLALREREAILAQRLESVDPYGFGSEYDYAADMGMGGYGNGAASFGLDYHAY